MSNHVGAGTTFFYPCAGMDAVDPIEQFGSVFDVFVFVDTQYDLTHFHPPHVPGWVEESSSIEVEGPLRGQPKTVVEENAKYRDLAPAWRRSRFVHQGTGREIAVVFRRGFGQYALHELEDQSIGMFLHRGDSSGEGGSGVIFLGNQRLDHPPISMMMDVLKRKLAYPALVGSDGSNTRIPQLRAATTDESVQGFESHCLKWTRWGEMPSQSRERTVIWRVSTDSFAALTARGAA